MSLLLRPWREHLPQFANLISPACALREHRSDTRVVPLYLVCALGEQRRSTALRPRRLGAPVRSTKAGRGYPPNFLTEYRRQC